MKIFLNYIGQIRLYSLADLVLLLISIGSTQYELAGAVILHLGFLAYLESRHAHEYRAKVPVWVSYLLCIIGLIFFGKIEGLLYVFFSYLYTKKTKNTGFFSPSVRGLQNFFIIAGILGYHSSIPYIVGIVCFIRNLLGDFRDTEKDRREGMKTIPVILGVKSSIPHIHLVGMFLSSFVWWTFSSISVGWLILVLIIQIATYHLTPR
jgi:4-hydroxybenzoate polyprenyltransferase